jgi:hypothetical protein
MASPSTVSRVLNDFSTNFNKGRDYQQQMYGRWMTAFTNTPDLALEKGVQKVCEGLHQYPPTLGHVVDSVKKCVTDLSGEYQIGVGKKKYNFCPECVDREGIVSTAAHYIWQVNDGTKKQGKYYWSIKDCVCGCEASLECHSKLRVWSERQRLLRKDKRLALITYNGQEGFWYTTRTNPYLKGIDHLGNYFDWTMDLNVFSDIQDKMKKRRSGELPPTAYTRMVDVLASGNTEVLAELLPENNKPLPSFE